MSSQWFKRGVFLERSLKRPYVPNGELLLKGGGLIESLRQMFSSALTPERKARQIERKK